MRGGAEVSTIGEWKALALVEPDARRRADFGGLALVFAELTDCRLQWQQALEGWNVEQSQQVLEWQAEAEKRGKIQGKEEGKVEGKAEGKADMVVRILKRRFAAEMTEDLAAKIRATHDASVLDSWLDVAYAANSLEDFRRTVNL
jgi:flagellar biosynthesis/type III secretory pathway protein FliH